jgi:hypothetical protein
MNFTKKFDHEDINNYLPDNKIVGTAEFFQNKYKKMPTYICEMLEVKSRNEYNDEKENEFLKLIKEAKKEEDRKLIEEFDKRQESITPLINELDELDNFKGVILEPAK